MILMRRKNEVNMSEPEYICLWCDKTFIEDELGRCHKCNEPFCPVCGGEIATIEEYDEAMKANSKEEE